jgi:peptidoglycan hydrolase-like protein with peptidoglycan-binding domain
MLMTLTWEPWRNENRIKQAELSKPSMKQGESGQPVHLLQAALVLNNFDIPLHGIVQGVNGGRQNNFFGPQTANAVRECERRFNLTQDVGIAGREVIGKLDFESALNFQVHTGQFGAALARADVPLAVGKVASSLLGLNFLRGGALPSTATPLVEEALRVHFRLLPPTGGPPDGIRRPRTNQDLDLIIRTFTRLAGVLNASATSFVDGIPVNGIKTPAESNTNSSIVLFGPFFRSFSEGLGAAIGPHSRAAILIHEGVHAIDDSGPPGLGRSGELAVHISEFQPAYDAQPADLSLFNPSSYASFAAHIALGRDPFPRFGLGAAQAQ